MELSMNMCEAIAKTLPTGYYCGRKIPIEVDETKPRSEYDYQTDSIKLSYSTIAQSIADIDESVMSQETAIRSALYHELSHLLLTNRRISKDDYSMVGKTTDEYTEEQIISCFEDERVETLLNDYYMGVNFKQQYFNAKGSATPQNSENPFVKFENLVRYRYGSPQLLEEVKRIISKYQDLNASNYTSRYLDEIVELFNKVKNDNTPQEQMVQDEQTLQNELKAKIEKSASKPQGQEDKPTDGEQQEGEGKGEGKGETENEAQSKDTDNSEQQDSESKTAEEMSQECGRGLREKMKQIAEQAFDPNWRYPLSESQKRDLEKARKTIEMLINNFNKKNSGGNGYNGYSGIFNPRAVVRDDYKYFDRKTSVNGNNPFGTCHLNLLIDKSGSFSPNTGIVNALLRMLSEIEDNTPCFSMDVGFIDETIHPTTRNTRVLRCCGGNDIDPVKYKAYMDSKRKVNCYNYDIVLFDGLACYYSSEFAAVDRENTTLITDRENMQFMRGSDAFKKARVIVTSNYANELINNVVKAIGRMFS